MMQFFVTVHELHASSIFPLLLPLRLVLPSPIKTSSSLYSISRKMNDPVSRSHQPPRVAHKGSPALNKMTSVNHNSLELYQNCTPHQGSLLQDTKITGHPFWESTTSAALEFLINCDELENFPKIEWCGDDVEGECFATVTKMRDPIKKPRKSSCGERTNEDIVARHHHHGLVRSNGLVRSMRIRSRLSALAVLLQAERPSYFKRNDDKPALSTAVMRSARRQYKRRDLAAAHGEKPILRGHVVIVA